MTGMKILKHLHQNSKQLKLQPQSGQHHREQCHSISRSGQVCVEEILQGELTTYKASPPVAGASLACIVGMGPAHPPTPNILLQSPPHYREKEKDDSSCPPLSHVLVW